MFIVMVLLLAEVQAQQTASWQARTIFRPTVDVSKRWYAAGWVIGNLTQSQADNINVLGGIGYRRNNWWAEALVQRQWSGAGRLWLLDCRAAGSMGRWQFYGEAAPMLGHGAVYDMATVEYALGKGVSIGGETENVHRHGPDDWSAGPRINKSLPVLGPVHPSLAVTWHVGLGQPQVVRVYLIVGYRRKKPGR